MAKKKLSLKYHWNQNFEHGYFLSSHCILFLVFQTNILHVAGHTATSNTSHHFDTKRKTLMKIAHLLALSLTLVEKSQQKPNWFRSSSQGPQTGESLAVPT